jgi:dihydropyrimidinase
MCSPPPRTKADQEALWEALASRDLQVISSDHAPYAFDATGKLKNGPQANFKQIASGLPGIELRMPLMFDTMVSNGRLGLNAFVELTATGPAKMFGLYPRKGTIAVGADADIAIWDPSRAVQIQASMLHDQTGYTPFEGRTLKGWPETVVLRGRVLVEDGSCREKPGTGVFLPLPRWRTND